MDLPDKDAPSKAPTRESPLPVNDRLLEDVISDLEASELVAQYRLLAMAVQQTADSVLITDERGIIQYVNPGFEATTGYTQEDVIGLNPRILKSGNHDKQFYKNLWQKITDGLAFKDRILNKKKNGELYWSEQTITPIKDSQGRITNFVSVLKDISDLIEKERQDVRLDIARKIQQRLFPKEINIPGIDIVGKMEPAEETGGDYFDYIVTPDDSLWMALGDVCDHGIGPALFMAETRAYLRSVLKMAIDPGEVLAKVNQELVTDTGGADFVTMILARLDLKNNTLVYGSAGHTPGYLMDRSGRTKHMLKRTGLPLGVFEASTYETSAPIQLFPGEMLVLLSDGITEAGNRNGTPFEARRALDVVRQYQHQDAGRIVEQLFHSVLSYLGGKPHEDDLTALVCKIKASN